MIRNEEKGYHRFRADQRRRRSGDLQYGRPFPSWHEPPG